MTKFVTTLNIILSWIIYPLSFLFPRNNKIWAFIGWHKNVEREIFGDNAKYLFLHVSQNHKEIKTIWIGRDRKICKVLQKRGYRAYYIHSLPGIYYSLRAGLTIIDAVMQINNWRYSGGSKTVQLWHADGIKRLSFTDQWCLKNALEIFNQPGSFKSFEFIIASSEYIRDIFICPSFNVSKEKVRITGLPRHDSLLRVVKDVDIDLHGNLKLDIDRVREKGIERLILYVPTFRRGKTLKEQLSPLNFESLDQFLKQQNYHLIISLHPKFAASNWIPEKTFTNITFSNPGFDQYALFKEFDLLITDYSSICIDFIVMNKPSIFYIYDIDEYRQNEGLTEDYWRFMPGPRVTDQNELEKALSIDLETLRQKNNPARDIVIKHRDGNSSGRVTQEIMSVLATPQ